MDDSSVVKLPEVDTLPDGFVDSSSDALPLSRPSLELLHYDLSSETQNELVTNRFVVIQRVGEKAHSRSFPVALDEKDGYVASGEPRQILDDGIKEQSELTSEKYAPSPASCAVSVDHKLKESSNDENGRDLPECTGTLEGLDTEADRSKVAPASESQKMQKGMPEVKRRSSKKSFKTEKEFLEFSLSYQQVLAERNAAISIRDKLESLCRELQRQNKTLAEECLRISEEEQNSRLKLTTKFHEAVQGISDKLEEQKGEFLSQLKENEMLRDKLKQLADQHALSEQQHARQPKQKALELRIAELKIQQYEEKSTHEQAQIKLYSEQVAQLLATENHLRSQLTSDGEKFQQFQDALIKSNEVFETYKQEIEKMVNATKDLKKENTFLKSKCEKSDYTLVELLEERERLKKQVEKTRNQKEKLESLCRSLQAERKQILSGNDISNSVHLQT